MSQESMSRLRVPSVETVRAEVNRYYELWLDAMFLQYEGFAYERDQKNPFANGLLYITVIGVIVALANIIGTALRFATSPSADAIKNTVLVHLQAMPFYTAFDPATATAFDQGYNQFWNQFGALILGYPTDDAGFFALALSVITTPLGLVLVWLLYGALVHLVARGWNPETSFGEMLAPLALAASPHLLNVLAIFPGMSASGAVIALWMFICNVVAIRVAYNTSTRRALWGAVFPILLGALLLLLTLIAAAFLVPVRQIVGGAQ